MHQLGKPYITCDMTQWQIFTQFFTKNLQKIHNCFVNNDYTKYLPLRISPSVVNNYERTFR